MKKKILLKTLVVAAPLLGVVSPVASCKTMITNADTTILSSEMTYGATITLFSRESVSLPHVVAKDAYSFSISLPAGWHGKKISRAMWITQTEFEQKAHHWRTCKIVPISDGSYVITTESDEKTPINDDIVINVEKVEPISATVGSFQNDTWDDLAYWTTQVYNGPGDDSVRENKLREIYAIPADQDFVGLERTVTFGGVQHKAVVASTFQLEKVKSGHTHDFPLDSEFIDSEHHAAFTFQFENLLTQKDGSGKNKLVTHKFDNDKDEDAQCWIEYGADFDHYSSDLRNYLNSKKDFFDKFDSSENLVEHIMPVAKNHFESAEINGTIYLDGEETYVCDRFFVPTALQLNSETHPLETVTGKLHEWHTEKNAVPTFELYANKENTDGAADYRALTAVGSTQTSDYWLASPCDNGEAWFWEPENTLVIQKDGSIGNRDCNEGNKGILLCFSI